MGLSLVQFVFVLLLMTMTSKAAVAVTVTMVVDAARTSFCAQMLQLKLEKLEGKSKKMGHIMSRAQVTINPSPTKKG